MGWYNDYGYNNGAGIGMVLMMLLFWLPLIALGIWLVARVTRPDVHAAPPAPYVPQHPADSGRGVLDRRFASGEITTEQYKEMRRILESEAGK